MYRPSGGQRLLDINADPKLSHRNRFTSETQVSRPLLASAGKALLLAICACVLYSCSTPTEPAVSESVSDTALTISGVALDFDAMFIRSLVGQSSNWRMKQFIRTCETSDTVRVGFIGGSITAGAITSRPELRYSTRFCSFLSKSFPNIGVVHEINAGIGATGSRFACSRVQEDLLAKHPDLIVIEFAVNDLGQGDSARIGSTFEGLLRQCLAYSARVPVVAVFFSAGNGTNVQSVHSEVGARYGIPMISYRDAVYPLVEGGALPWNSVFHDDTHPNDNGHLIAARLLVEHFLRSRTATADKQVGLPSTLFGNIFEHAGILSATDSCIQVLQSSWQRTSQRSAGVGFTSTSAMDSLQIVARCNELTIGIHMQPFTPSRVRIVVGAAEDEMVLTNTSTFEYTRFVPLFLSGEVGPHTVNVFHLDSNMFSIDCLLYAGR